MIAPPTPKEKATIRILILFGLLSIANFFYWFLKPELIGDKLLFGLLLVPIVYDSLRLTYIWYHYWDISTPTRPGTPTNQLTADVFTTYFPGEPYDMIQETLLAIQKIRYPHTTYLCDEANDPFLKDFCLQHGIIHVTRNNRINAKAGNINNALLQAKGDICLILDPDHIPSENFLDETIPYFEDDTIGFVQSVQAYYNIGESLVAQGAAEQTFHFYGPVMMTMNSYGTVNAIGANCVFRRKALDSIGGHAPGLAEDMHTAMQLHAKGWKSVYVPKIFSKGLVPASLTAYYKQQLKWSRGTMELLVSVYPKLFKNFSWRQKLHYGILPLHYLSGFIYMISFLIPIISLFSASTPWNGNVLNFGLIFLPILSCILGIRFYIQRWVMDKSERGVHLIGGLLMTVTWWVFALGCIYTLIRKKVPYLPTPKEDKERSSWKILVPNLMIAILSIIAIIYGLSVDLTPFSIFMAGFALLNISFMCFTLIFAYQKPNSIKYSTREVTKSGTRLNSFGDQAFILWRKIALPAIMLIFIGSGFQFYYNDYMQWAGTSTENEERSITHYLGIFEPRQDNGLSSLKKVADISKEIDRNFDIVSLYQAWDPDIQNSFPRSLLDSIYTQKSIPLFTWEPWTNNFDPAPDQDQHVFELIAQGFFDGYIQEFALNLKKLNRPVFLRFAHEFDNPFYPWYRAQTDAPSLFKEAWRHTFRIFKQQGADNVIWVWNPWKPEHVSSFYPGDDYVDWIGINILNYGKYNPDGKDHDFADLYEPFHLEFKNLKEVPVIITEFGCLKSEKDYQTKWFQDAHEAIRTKYGEIKSIIYFNSKVDDNWPNNLNMGGYLDWSISDNSVIKSIDEEKKVPVYLEKPLPQLIQNKENIRSRGNLLKNIKGINLKKGNNWNKDYHILSRKNLLWDFDHLNKLGINTIKYIGNDVYDYNLLNISKEKNLDISYGFWIPAHLDFVKDTIALNSLSKNILHKIKKHRDKDHIISWNLLNDVLSDQGNYYEKPELLYQNLAFIIWLRELAENIRALDGQRPLTVDLEVNQLSFYHSKLLTDHINGLDALGLVIRDDEYLDTITHQLKDSGIAYIFSEMNVTTLMDREKGSPEIPFYITAWQDRHESDNINFEGIIDRKNRFKTDYYQLEKYLHKIEENRPVPKISILRPASLVYDNKTLNYQAMWYTNDAEWVKAKEIKDLKYEWALVKTDAYGNSISIKEVGKDPELSLKVPEDNDRFRLLLTVSKGDTILTKITELNTPLRQEGQQKTE